MAKDVTSEKKSLNKDSAPKAEKGMTDDRLKALLGRELSTANSDRAPKREKDARALKYYQGDVEADLPSQPNRSKLVDSTLSDNVGWIMPQLMRLFASSFNFFKFEPTGEEDDDWADQATKYVNHLWWKKMDGYRILHSATWDSLVVANGIVKTWYDPTPEYEVTYHTGLTEESYAELVVEDEELDAEDRGDDEPRDDKIEVLSKNERTETVPTPTQDPETGEMVIVNKPVTVIDCRLRRLKRKGRIRCEAIPPEDYVKNKSAVTCDEARFQAHRETVTKSDLILMGFDRKKVDDLGREANTDDGEIERLARNDSDEDEAASENKEVDLWECYYRVDINGDGISEMVRAFYAGAVGSGSASGTLLEWEEWEDEPPFDDIPCEPMPHKFDARSLADDSIDIVKVKTALIRGAMDNTYQHNNPGKFVRGTILNPDALFSSKFGQVIFGDTDAVIEPQVTPYVADKSLASLEYFDNVNQKRTGIGRQGVALDTDAIQKQTATASQIEHDAGYSQVEVIARNHAELGWKKIGLKLLKLVIKHQDGPEVFRFQGEPMHVDPRSWNADMDVSVNTGMGTGSRERDVAMLQITLNNQFLIAQKVAEAGMTDKSLELLPYVSRTLERLTEATGLHNPEDYFPKIQEEDIAAMQEAMKNQPPPIEIQLEKMKQEGAVNVNKAKADADVEKTKVIEMAKAEAAAIKEKAQADADAIIAKVKAEQESAVEIAKIKSNEKLAFMDAKVKLAIAGIEVGPDVVDPETGEVVDIGTPVSSQALLQEVMQGMGMLSEQMAAAIEASQSAAAAALAPKRATRGPDGKLSGIEIDDSFFDPEVPDGEQVQ